MALDDYHNIESLYTAIKATVALQMVIMNETGFLALHDLSDVSFDESNPIDVEKMEAVKKVFRQILEINDTLKQIESENN